MFAARKLNKIFRLFSYSVGNPACVLPIASQITENIRGLRYARRYGEAGKVADAGMRKPVPGAANRLEEYFDSLDAGRGIWKWRHYFEIYDRHFRKFVGRNAIILEIGVYSGGSLEMWRNYFGPHCRIYGVDIAPECKDFEDEQTTILIGDQENRGFWRDVINKIPQVDVLIDDGGHEFNQQIVTFEEMLPHIAPGGVYLCEDLHGTNNGFNSYCQAFTKCLNENNSADSSAWEVRTNAVQKSVKGMFFYPFVTVIEKNDWPVEQLLAEKHGTLWQSWQVTTAEAP